MPEEQNLGAALALAQAEFPTIERTKTVKVKTKTGASYTFSYAPLESILHAVRPVLKKHGLAVTQLLTSLDGARALETRLLHKSGEHISGVFPLSAQNGMGPQELGSLLTYMRRYALVAILGIATEEDDDANSAAGNEATATGYERRVNPETPVPKTFAEVEALWTANDLDVVWLEQASKVKRSVQMLARACVLLLAQEPAEPFGYSREQIQGVFAGLLDGVVLEGPPAVSQEELDRMTAKVLGRVEGEEDIPFGDSP